MRKKRTKREVDSDYPTGLIEQPKRDTFYEGKKKQKFFPEEKKNKVIFVPKTDNQKIAWEYFKNKPIVILSGVAGSGKSLISTAYACQQLAKGNYDKLVITRNAVGIGKSIGFFPGDVNEKLSTWVSNILGFIREIVGQATLDIWLKSVPPKIELKPTEVLRGCSFTNSIVLIEEAQQCTIDDLKCITTRIGKDSLMILTGDTSQSDCKNSGLEQFCNIVEKYQIDDIGIVHFTTDDILRHDVVKKIILAFDKEGL